MGLPRPGPARPGLYTNSNKRARTPSLRRPHFVNSAPSAIPQRCLVVSSQLPSASPFRVGGRRLAQPVFLRQFYRECDIYGTVDFNFGNAAAVLQGCHILPRVLMTGQQDTITTQGKTNPNQNIGISIHSCSMRPWGNLSIVAVYLGRPWKSYSTVFMRSVLSGIINPAKWLPWSGDLAPNTIFYGKYRNGAGGVHQESGEVEGAEE